MDHESQNMMRNTLGVIQFLRKPHGNLHSVERTFADVRSGLLSAGQPVTVRVNRFISKGVFPRLYDAVAARLAAREVNHVTGDVHYLCWFLPKKRTILTVLDCVGLHRLRGWRQFVFKLLWYRIPARRSRYITVISNFTREDLISQIGIPEDKIHTIYLSVSDEFVPHPRNFNTNRPRILIFATSPTKNIERIVAALKGVPCELVVIGFMNSSQRNAVANSGLSVENRESLNREEMLQIYRTVDLVVLASTFEGFGLPIVESQAIGRPVVTSNTCSMPEVAGGGACLVDPNVTESIREGILRVIRDAAYREDLVARGLQNVQRFRREEITRQYLELYSRVADDETC